MRQESKGSDRRGELHRRLFCSQLNPAVSVFAVLPKAKHLYTN